MKKIAAFAVIAASSVAAPAMAKDTGGVRVEAIGGYDHVSVDVDGFSLGKSGVVYGIAAGYDYPVGKSLSLGVEGEVSGASSKYEVTESGVVYSFKTGRDFYAGVRVSIPVGNAVNAFVRGGYSNTRLTVAAGTDSESGNLNGFRAGVGLQYNISKNLYATGEYRYSNYESNFSRSQVAAGLGVRF